MIVPKPMAEYVTSTICLAVCCMLCVACYVYFVLCACVLVCGAVIIFPYFVVLLLADACLPSA